MEASEALSAAIGTVLSRFRAMVRSVGSRRGLLDGDLDEVMQEVRIRLWQAHKSGKEIEALGSSYLYQTASSAALDLLRRRRAKGGALAEELGNNPELRAKGPGPEDDAVASDLSRRIDAALDELSPERRVAVRFHLTGYNHTDIANALGWTEAKARNLLYRGLTELRRRLELMGVSPTNTR